MFISDFNLLFTELEGDVLVAQAAIFFTAGFESNASTTSFTLYELAMQPHLQTRLREEILRVLDENEGEFTYEAVRDMEYLHMVISGTTVLDHQTVPNSVPCCRLHHVCQFMLVFL
jgi:cytochrome P450 family 6